MYEQTIEMILNKFLTQAKSIEDLAWILICAAFVMLIYRLSNSALKIGRQKSSTPKKLTDEESLSSLHEKGAKVQDLFWIEHTCKNRHKFLNELQIISAENAEIKSKLAKIMNIMSKEYESKYDRYLFDSEISPKDKEDLF